jgi:hypothetical protein
MEMNKETFLRMYVEIETSGFDQGGTDEETSGIARSSAFEPC